MYVRVQFWSYSSKVYKHTELRIETPYLSLLTNLAGIGGQKWCQIHGEVL